MPRREPEWADVIWWLRCNIFNAGVITLVLGMALASLQGTAGLILMAILVVSLKRVIDKERSEAWCQADDHEELRRLRAENSRLRQVPHDKEGVDHYWSAPN